MSICLEHLHEYELTCCPSNHNIPVEMRAASSLALSDTSLLLINSGTDRLLLYDLSLSACKLHDINWPSDTYGVIRDICWSKYINSFLILGDDVVCSYSPISNQLIIVLKSPSLNDRFWSLTVLGYDAYILCRHDTLYRYCLPTWTLCHTWSRTDLIDICTTDKFIQMIRAHPSMGSIALLIRLKRHRQWRIDLFDRRMKKLHSGEPIRMASAYPNVNIRPYAHHGQWILMNEDFIWRIDFNGQLIEHQSRQQKKEIDQ
ncbi:unnamed protein product [Rotaria magnacalcarata]|uniref:Uncharacterized protein n=1 Tax=Rotaria magnacalcarata TaxID=392030 RepID=A0A816WD48_9BILA|nr:unnamed protein product [Rotaria magnacalcarata]CAF2239648.1 unnamed protein product [Rotaria magnacalcarata]CAF3956903.1 unnamed protein product [Rotaria magnacalcarata]CAF4016280.1 unnamed protein product [Rotaria magnacalcarata]